MYGLMFFLFILKMSLLHGDHSLCSLSERKLRAFLQPPFHLILNILCRASLGCRLEKVQSSLLTILWHQRSGQAETTRSAPKEQEWYINICISSISASIECTPERKKKPWTSKKSCKYCKLLARLALVHSWQHLDKCGFTYYLNMSVLWRHATLDLAAISVWCGAILSHIGLQVEVKVQFQTDLSNDVAAPERGRVILHRHTEASESHLIHSQSILKP